MLFVLIDHYIFREAGVNLIILKTWHLDQYGTLDKINNHKKMLQKHIHTYRRWAAYTNFLCVDWNELICKSFFFSIDTCDLKER